MTTSREVETERVSDADIERWVAQLRLLQDHARPVRSLVNTRKALSAFTELQSRRSAQPADRAAIVEAAGNLARAMERAHAKGKTFPAAASIALAALLHSLSPKDKTDG